jgi:hypothetical protein
MWHKDTQLLVWHRLKHRTPGFLSKTVTETAAWLVCFYETQNALPLHRDKAADVEEEEEILQDSAS